VEVPLWSAVRALEEQTVLAKRIAERARKSNHEHAVRVFEKRAQESEGHGSLIRELLLGRGKGDNRRASIGKIKLTKGLR